jgi:hypothetical protein
LTPNAYNPPAVVVPVFAPYVVIVGVKSVLAYHPVSVELSVQVPFVKVLKSWV